MPGHTVQPFSEVLLCGHEIALVLLHRRQHAQIALYPAVVVVGDVILNHGNNIFPAREAFTIVPFSFENTPESFHRAIVNALGNSGHALLHLCGFQLVVKDSVRILETSVAMEQRMCIGVSFYGSIQCIEHQGLSLRSRIINATILRSYRSRMALRYSLCTVGPSYHLNSVTSVSHFSLGILAWN